MELPEATQVDPELEEPQSAPAVAMAVSGLESYRNGLEILSRRP